MHILTQYNVVVVVAAAAATVAVDCMRIICKFLQGQNYECNFTWPMSFKVKKYIHVWIILLFNFYEMVKNTFFPF